ncbi:RidA family protein [Pseudonocardia acaciae]|uniref:RidA family protein n=1 Tax=Pseudonocardia acaciae TaxID=551276 RepID=UPI000A621631|nr:RidA family protein [Pseudonocardia acaciae]
MAITRQHFMVGDIKAAAPGPVISQVVTHNDTVYLAGIVTLPPNPDDDVRTQTRKVLQRIDELLASEGTDKSKILSAQVWLADMDTFAEHNEIWNEWVDPDNPPVRVCVEARLAHPDFLVEIQVTAAR